ncbi:hypothetical protein QEH42_gp237 [Microbacterium phage Pumpernickel]|uniref:Uncharacterized protein n=1 Tax=Microbacterium phage Pumpernickel TaxID=2885983 RepID=A0AAE8Y8N7_9CAUD|nr:hypothetical protein QEH42_gp237 [Microbacterium phage Pumpernickel]UDL15981.1 hypothetical protein SEA_PUMPERNICKEL_231 [Microbacterium phage Pumpernickel]
MKVSLREESLAKELYEKDMGLHLKADHQNEIVPWDRQIDYVKNSYYKQASTIVNSKWFKQQLYEASLLGAHEEAISRDNLQGKYVPPIDNGSERA